MNRRSFLFRSAQGLILLGTQHFVPKTLASSLLQKNQIRFIVHIHFNGGWDVVLGPNPWIQSSRPNEKDLFLGYAESEVIDGRNLSVGPSMDPMKPYLEEMAIINGIFQDSPDGGMFHTAGQTIITCGNSSLPSLLEEVNQQDQTPLGIISTSRGFPKKNTFTVSQISKLRNDHTRIDELTESMSGAFTHSLKKLNSEKKEVEKKLENLKNTSSYKLRPDHIANLFKLEIASQAYYSISRNLDTHSNHLNSHLESQRRNWREVADLVKTFKRTPYGKKGESLYAHTTFMITSDFSRTPALNLSAGKDHDGSNNSIVLLGGGVKGGVVRGSSELWLPHQNKRKRSWYMGSEFNFKTGQSEKGAGTPILPVDALYTVMDICNLSLEKTEIHKLKPKIIPGIKS
ncbi:MAG: hypothetical protein CL678_02775 [Bdellovibrionaceae bacterium]|nr:hypothetical protein [Pseudobdellovibrionaceae bacterium]|tara:strand:- start:419 stop:1621 length:1203 start_codon:yes stop_codon:yes gene_type:complete